MKTCPECAEDISPSDEICPYCDADLEAIKATRRRRPRSSSDVGDDPAMRMMLPVGRSGWAIAAGYFGLFSLICLPAPIALILGIVAIIDIKKNPEKRGMGRAIFGVVMGILGCLGFFTMIVTSAVRG